MQRAHADLRKAVLFLEEDVTSVTMSVAASVLALSHFLLLAVSQPCRSGWSSGTIGGSAWSVLCRPVDDIWAVGAKHFRQAAQEASRFICFFSLIHAWFNFSRVPDRFSAPLLQSV